VTTQSKTTAIYVRSGTHSAANGQSLAAQEQACRASAAAQGWRVGEVFAAIKAILHVFEEWAVPCVSVEQAMYLHPSEPAESE
jgi:hypothetical protein